MLCLPDKNQHLPGHRDRPRAAIICLKPQRPGCCSAVYPHAGGRFKNRGWARIREWPLNCHVLPLNIKRASRFLRKWPSATLDIEPPEALWPDTKGQAGSLARVRDHPLHGAGKIPRALGCGPGRPRCVPELPAIANDRRQLYSLNLKETRASRAPMCQVPCATVDGVPVACPIGRSTPGTHDHWRIAGYTGSPADTQADPLRIPAFSAAGQVARQRPFPILGWPFLLPYLLSSHCVDSAGGRFWVPAH